MYSPGYFCTWDGDGTSRRLAPTDQVGEIVEDVERQVRGRGTTRFISPVKASDRELTLKRVSSLLQLNVRKNRKFFGKFYETNDYFRHQRNESRC